MVITVTDDCPHMISTARLGVLASFAAYTTVPNRTPTPAVIPIASAPQNVMRITLGTIVRRRPCGQRPQKRQEDQRSRSHGDNQSCLRGEGGDDRGITAPTAKLPAEANAA